MSQPPATPKFKALRPEPLDSPIYSRGYLVGATVFGKKAKNSPPSTKPAPKAK